MAMAVSTGPAIIGQPGAIALAVSPTRIIAVTGDQIAEGHHSALQRRQVVPLL